MEAQLPPTPAPEVEAAEVAEDNLIDWGLDESEAVSGDAVESEAVGITPDEPPVQAAVQEPSQPSLMDTTAPSSPQATAASLIDLLQPPSSPQPSTPPEPLTAAPAIAADVPAPAPPPKLAPTEAPQAVEAEEEQFAISNTADATPLEGLTRAHSPEPVESVEEGAPEPTLEHAVSLKEGHPVQEEEEVEIEKTAPAPAVVEQVAEPADAEEAIPVPDAEDLRTETEESR